MKSCLFTLCALMFLCSVASAQSVTFQDVREATGPIAVRAYQPGENLNWYKAERFAGGIRVVWMTNGSTAVEVPQGSAATLYFKPGLLAEPQPCMTLSEGIHIMHARQRGEIQVHGFHIPAPNQKVEVESAPNPVILGPGIEVQDDAGNWTPVLPRKKTETVPEGPALPPLPVPDLTVPSAPTLILPPTSSERNEKSKGYSPPVRS
jgi:hypothetical protein